MPRNLFEKLWDAHVVRQPEAQPALLYIDLHLVHEVTSPQAFEALREAGRGVRRPDLTFATADHNVPTTDRSLPIARCRCCRVQIETLSRNCAESGIRLFDINSAEQGIVHVIGPELGLSQPGMTIVCGDSHTSTHGAFGALAFGIGTSEVEHVLATQCLPQNKPDTMLIEVRGELPAGRDRKGPGARHHWPDWHGRRLGSRNRICRAKLFVPLSMEGRMTLCNMSIGSGRACGHDRA